MAEIKNDEIIIPITYADDDHLTINTDAIRKDFEELMAELEEEFYE
jgi:hypothetical protein